MLMDWQDLSIKSSFLQITQNNSLFVAVKLHQIYTAYIRLLSYQIRLVHCTVLLTEPSGRTIISTANQQCAQKINQVGAEVRL
jgi:hypothetical protein